MTVVLPNVDPNAYPVERWAERREKYSEYWYHFDGRFLDEKDENGNPRFPLGLNPFALACYIHAAFLFGEYRDGQPSLALPVVQARRKASRKAAEIAQQFLLDVWEDNSGVAIQMEGGIIAQVMGGVVYGVFYDPLMREEGKEGIRIDLVLPEYFFPAWAHNQYWNLQECIIAYEITALQAQELGVTAHMPSVLYQEHWTRERYEITVDGKVASWGGVKLAGRTPAGLVPYVYIPHIRVGDFYGISLLEGKELLAREVNDRYADVGDIIAENARLLPAIWGTNRPTVRHLSGGYHLLDLGMPAPGRPEPGIAYPSGSIQVNQPTAQWSKELLTLAWVSAFVPPIVFGLDEGSQRSALTLALRMMPIISHIRKERVNWEEGLRQIARRVLLVAAEHGLIDLTAEEIGDLRIHHEWAPILPRDAQQFINDMILLFNANLISQENAIQRLGLTSDVNGEIERIRAWMEYRSSVGAGMPGTRLRGAGAMGEMAGMGERPDEPDVKSPQEEGNNE